MAYIAKKHLNHGQFGYIVVDDATQHCLGGFGANFYRAWVFPLYTPNGLTVLQEFPYDHPFHNGMWVAQGPIMMDGRESHFWPSPPMRVANEALFENMGRMDVGVPDVVEMGNGIRFHLSIRWVDKNEDPVLDEERTVAIYADAEGTVCDMWSQKVASYGALEYVQSKFGSIGIRVEPRILPDFGGVVLANGRRRGTADIAIDQACTYVAYENGLSCGERFGVLMTALDPETNKAGVQTGPWFVRDYGMAMYNVNRNEPIYSSRGDSWTVGLRVLAYDGPMSDERANRVISI